MMSIESLSWFKIIKFFNKAHCTAHKMAEQLSVRAGSSYWDEGGVLMQVLDFYSHEFYRNHPTRHPFDYDYSLLEISGSFLFSDTIKAVQLPIQFETIQIGTALVSGWGAQHFNTSNLPKQLHAANVTTIEFDKCCDSYGRVNISDGMFCAGVITGGIDSCQGSR